MIATCSRLEKGTEWESRDGWAVVLKRDACTRIPLTGFSLIFMSGPQILGKLDPMGRLTICMGYACDGYSPVVTRGAKHFRLTPTPRCGLFPAVLHDFLRQFLGVEGCPWGRYETDLWFAESLSAGGSPLARIIYHAAVAGPIGSAFIRLTRKTDPTLKIVAAESW